MYRYWCFCISIFLFFSNPSHRIIRVHIQTQVFSGCVANDEGVMWIKLWSLWSQHSELRCLDQPKNIGKNPGNEELFIYKESGFGGWGIKGCSLHKLDQHKSWWSLSFYRSFVLVTLHSECKAWVIYLDFTNSSPGSKREVPTEMGPKKKPQPPGLVSQPPLEKAPLPRPQHPLLRSN